MRVNNVRNKCPCCWQMFAVVERGFQTPIDRKRCVAALRVSRQPGADNEIPIIILPVCNVHMRVSFNVKCVHLFKISGRYMYAKYKRGLQTVLFGLQLIWLYNKLLQKEQIVVMLGLNRRLKSERVIIGRQTTDKRVIKVTQVNCY